MARKFRTEFVYPPIPVRSFDWSAVTDNYEPGHPIGYGTTEQEAVRDLLEQIETSGTTGAPIPGCRR